MSAQPLVETVIGLLGVSSGALFAPMLADWFKANRKARAKQGSAAQGAALAARIAESKQFR